ncbi:MAG: hypothetical protein OXM61_07080 [Candidatus Poribacteria bacterium]|nr:hypothetical protein [Candidatus Poribacteria bacterium]
MQAIENRNVSEPPVLTLRQQNVLDVLKTKETDKYNLSKWYLGALYALNNRHNPDRIAQAAHSLRELVEKLPRVLYGSDVQGTTPNFKEKRSNINRCISRAKKHYPEGWRGNKIDKHLAKALIEMEEYLELNQQPNRKERVQQAIASIDPMYYQLHSEIQEAKRDQLLKLWERLENFTHHNSNPDTTEFKECLEELEIIVFDLLAPITAQDQKEIQTILNMSDKSEDDFERMFRLIERKGANSVFFFKQVSESEDITWLPFLTEKRYFTHPPSAQILDDSRMSYPFWWPIRYLVKISKQAPDKVIEILLQLPKVNNPLVYDSILEIALQLDGKHSAKLKPKMLEYANMENRFLAYKFANLLNYWTKQNQTSAALELSKILVAFAPDPRSEEKKERRNDYPVGTSLYPIPKIGHMEYAKIMSEGIRPLAESEPYKVTRLLIDATKNMIRLGKHQDELDKQVDSSEIWCPRFQNPDSTHGGPKETLIHTLTFACEKVYEKSPDAIVELDKLLRRQKWNIFKRLRQYLYAQFPNEKTKPWIREFILTHKGYHRSEHRHAFQQMIRNASKHFGETLLTKSERTQIFDCILGGPVKDDAIEEGFQKYQRYFHRMQFTPFKAILFGVYETYFQKLECITENQISDDDYLPFGVKFGLGSRRSPRTPEELTNLTDEDLLNFINEWEKENEFSDNDPHVRINIEELANAFQTVFRESIISDAGRLRFWMENYDRIERPIYVRTMIYAMQEDVKAKKFDNLNDWLDFSEWVLTHPDREHEDGYRRSDNSREYPDWSSTRRAVGDFIDVCLEREVDVPITFRGQLAQILETLSTQFDNHLKQSFPSNDPSIDSYTEGINSTRGRALKGLIKFCFWLRRQDSECEIPEVITILEKRFAQKTEYPLTLPEYAVLGKNYCYFFDFSEVWATKHKTDFFPQEQLGKWLAAFGSLVGYSDSYQPTFEVLQDDFKFALQHLPDFKKRIHTRQETIDILGQHLFIYYLWGMYPLTGEESLLERFYQKTDKEHWGNLFNDIGHRLWNSGETLDRDMKDRVIAFFEWRFKKGEPSELKYFTVWLQAECLDVEWRLNAYSKVIDVSELEDWEIYSNLKELCQMLPKHTAKVVECFAKLTDGIRDNIYIQAEEAEAILTAGRNSRDAIVQENAERALDNLLRAGRSEFLNLAIGKDKQAVESGKMMLGNFYTKQY